MLLLCDIQIYFSTIVCSDASDLNNTCKANLINKAYGRKLIKTFP